MKKRILIIVLVVLVVITGVMGITAKNRYKKADEIDELGRKTIHQTELLYIHTNSWIKIEYEEIFKSCSEESTSEICSDIETKVISVEPFSSSNKKIYNNVYLLNKDIYEEIVKIVSVANDNKIDISRIDIISNSGNFMADKINLGDFTSINYEFDSNIDEQELLNRDMNQVTVIFNNGLSLKYQTLVKGETAREPEEPQKSGYTFKGWMLDNELYDFTTPVNEDITLIAKWEEDIAEPFLYTITFDSAGGSKVEEEYVEENSFVNKPVDPTKKGYTFVAWTLDGEEYDFSTPVTDNIELVATWTK